MDPYQAPSWRQRLRSVAAALDASPVETVGLGILLLSGCAAAAVVLWLAQPRPASDAAGLGTLSGPAAGTGVGGPATGATADATAPAPNAPAGGARASSGRATVHVAGAVAAPGVVELPAGSRVADALAVAGGPLPDADPAALNLARVVTDGQQVYVPRVGEAPPPAGAGETGSAPPGSAPAPADPAGVVDLNRATAAELETLPGIGPVLAQRIIDWRTRHGAFTGVGQLEDVPGIGERTLAELTPHVTVS